MSEQIKIHPLNVKGKYYVDIETCLDHECCVYEAPENFKMDEENWNAYVYKQPETEEEKTKFKEVMNWCPVEAIHDDGETENQ
jgi:ferredoxin